jgi:hypothetical protein
VAGILCSWDSCLRSEVELRDFPEGSFSGADNKDENPDHSEPYLGTVDITWPVADLKQPIVFAYMTDPYYRLPLVRTVLKPFEGVSSLDEAFFALLGVLGGAVGGLVVFATGVIGGALSDAVKENFKALLAKLRSPKQRTRQDEAKVKENKENDHEEEQR